jgi:hypothetical protein
MQDADNPVPANPLRALLTDWIKTYHWRAIEEDLAIFTQTVYGYLVSRLRARDRATDGPQQLPSGEALHEPQPQLTADVENIRPRQSYDVDVSSSGQNPGKSERGGNKSLPLLSLCSGAYGADWAHAAAHDDGSGSTHGALEADADDAALPAVYAYGCAPRSTERADSQAFAASAPRAVPSAAAESVVEVSLPVWRLALAEDMQNTLDSAPALGLWLLSTAPTVGT